MIDMLIDDLKYYSKIAFLGISWILIIWLWVEMAKSYI